MTKHATLTPERATTTTKRLEESRRTRAIIGLENEYTPAATKQRAKLLNDAEDAALASVHRATVRVTQGDQQRHLCTMHARLDTYAQLILLCTIDVTAKEYGTLRVTPPATTTEPETEAIECEACFSAYHADWEAAFDKTPAGKRLAAREAAGRR